MQEVPPPGSFSIETSRYTYIYISPRGAEMEEKYFGSVRGDFPS